MTHPLRRYCSADPTCPNRTNGGPCREHAVSVEHRRVNFQWRRLYRRAKWKHLRLRKLANDPFCEDCRENELTTAAVEVHHKIRPIDEAQFYDYENLRSLCTPCHSARTARGE